MSFRSKFHPGPPPTLQILFQDILVAELSKAMRGAQVVYIFKYLPAFKEQKLAALPGLPYSEQSLERGELWAFFAERIPDVRRPEIAALMQRKNLDPKDDIRMLAELGSYSVTDPFQIRMAA